MSQREADFYNVSKRVFDRAPPERVALLRSAGLALVPNISAWSGGTMRTIAKRIAKSSGFDAPTDDHVAAVAAIVNWLEAEEYLDAYDAPRGIRFVIGDRMRGEFERVMHEDTLRKLIEFKLPAIVRFWAYPDRECERHPVVAEWAPFDHPGWTTIDLGCGLCMVGFPDEVDDEDRPSRVLVNRGSDKTAAKRLV